MCLEACVATLRDVLKIEHTIVTRVLNVLRSIFKDNLSCKHL